jgi:hypothetical protein
MRPLALFRAATLALCVSKAGCASASGIQTVPLADGNTRIFAGNLESVLRAARESVVGAGFKIEEVNRVDDSTWMIVSTKGVDLTSVGQIVRLVVHRETANESTVRVVSQRKAAMQLLARRNYSETIFAGITTKLR